MLGSATAAAHQRRLWPCWLWAWWLSGVIAAWVLRQADQSVSSWPLGQSLMQSQTLAKSVLQAVVGSPRRPEVVESWACWRATSAPS